MTATATLWLVFAPALVGGLFAMALDMLSRPSAARTLASIALVASGIAGLYAGLNVPVQTIWGSLSVGGAYSTLPGLAFLLAGLAIAASRADGRVGGLAALSAFGVAGAAVALIATDVVTLLLGLETAALAGYALVSLGRSCRSTEAAMKYFVQGAVATGALVLGMAVLLGLFSSEPAYRAIAAAISISRFSTAAVLGVSAVVVAVAFKAGAAPFHSWAPDAYETAQPPAAAVLAAAVKLLMVGALAVFVTAMQGIESSSTSPLGVLDADLFPVLGGLAVISIVVGSTVALSTRSYTRMLGYAGVAQVGYALIALAALNARAALIFIATYAIGTTAAFLAAEAFRRIDPKWDGTVDGLAGMSRRAPLLSASLTLALVSLAGIPPLLGFWGKFQAFGAAVVTALLLGQNKMELAGFALATAAAVGIVGSIVSLGYYGNVVRAMYFSGEERTHTEKATGWSVPVLIVVALALTLVVLGVAPLLVGVPTLVAGFLMN